MPPRGYGPAAGIITTPSNQNFQFSERNPCSRSRQTLRLFSQQRSSTVIIMTCLLAIVGRGYFYLGKPNFCPKPFYALKTVKSTLAGILVALHPSTNPVSARVLRHANVFKSLKVCCCCFSSSALLISQSRAALLRLCRIENDWIKRMVKIALKSTWNIKLITRNFPVLRPDAWRTLTSSKSGSRSHHRFQCPAS